VCLQVLDDQPGGQGLPMQAWHELAKVLLG
jgi:hypothetical protein